VKAGDQSHGKFTGGNASAALGPSHGCAPALCDGKLPTEGRPASVNLQRPGGPPSGRLGAQHLEGAVVGRAKTGALEGSAIADQALTGAVILNAPGFRCKNWRFGTNRWQTLLAP
jgi:hypothetical protein